MVFSICIDCWPGISLCKQLLAHYNFCWSVCCLFFYLKMKSVALIRKSAKESVIMKLVAQTSLIHYSWWHFCHLVSDLHLVIACFCCSSALDSRPTIAGPRLQSDIEEPKYRLGNRPKRAIWENLWRSKFEVTCWVDSQVHWFFGVFKTNLHCENYT